MKLVTVVPVEQIKAKIKSAMATRGHDAGIIISTLACG